MTEPSVPAAGPGLCRAWRWLALAWLGVVLAVAAHQWRFWQQPAIDHDLLALLPGESGDPLLGEVSRRIADAGARDIVVLLGAVDAEDTARAEAAWRARLRQPGGAPLLEAESDAAWLEQAQAFYGPYSGRLLAPGQRERLAGSTPEALAQAALADLYGPVAPRFSRWVDDPLGLASGWWQARAASSGLRIDEDGRLQADGRHWAVLRLRTRAPAFSLDGERRVQTLLDEAAAAARRQVPDLRELRAGVPLHAEAAAVQASREINLIGWGSLAAVLLLAWLAFRSLRPLALVAGSLLVGCATALSATVALFGQVHLLTLVFGASLVGVAEDYGIHWFASRQGRPRMDRWRLLRLLLPGLLLALATSALAYLALGLAPFPGLRQMAVFSVVGLAAAFATVVCWFPWLDTRPVRDTRFSGRLGATLARWPLARRGRSWSLAALALAGLVAVGLWRLHPVDDLRSLQSSPPALVAQQAEVGRLLGLPSPAQFYVVRGTDAETVLRREEALTARLRALQAAGGIAGYRAVSDWLPSRQQQAADAALAAPIEARVLQRLRTELDEPLPRAAPPPPLALDAFLASPASQPVRTLWLGAVGGTQASVVLVDGLAGGRTPAALAAQADGLAGVRWVDRTADYSRLLGHYRRMMGGLLLVGVALVAGILFWRYRAAAWRVLLPTLVAGALTVALLGWLGQPFQLFNVLALLLLLGMGIDYGIFLLEQHGEADAWLAVCVGAASTWLSFGLLALSSTPALRAFGLTMLFGIGLVWLISPIFRQPAGPPAGRSSIPGTRP